MFFKIVHKVLLLLKELPIKCVVYDYFFLSLFLQIFSYLNPMINPENGLDNHSKNNRHKITQVESHLPLCDSGQEDSPLHSSEDSLDSLEGSQELTNSRKKQNKKLKVRSVSENDEGVISILILQAVSLFSKCLLKYVF